MRTDIGHSVRLVLAALLALQPVVQAAELAPVDILLTRAIPQDEAALATSGPEKGERLAIFQSDLALVVEGLEGFASEEDAAPSLQRLRESVDAPEQFKDRAAALDAVYRAIGDLYKRMGVAAKDILDALKEPLKIDPVVLDKQGRPSQRFIGGAAEVAANPSTGRILSVNPTSSAKARKLSR